MTSVSESRKIGRFFLGISSLVALALALLLAIVAPYLTHTVDAEQIAKAFTVFHGAGNSHPKPLAQIRYLIAIVFVPTIYLIAFLSYSKISNSRHASTFLQPKLLLLNQFLLTATIIFALVAQARGPHPHYIYFHIPQLLSSLLCATTICFLLYRRPQYLQRLRLGLDRALSSPMAWGIAGLLAIRGALPGLVGEANAYQANNILGFHLPFYVGEFFSTSSGKVPYAGFYPMYENLMVLLLIPMFKIFGYEISVLSTALVALSLVGLLAIYAAFAKLVGRSMGLVLYLPTLASATYSIVKPYGPHVANSLSYYANWPIRLLVPSLLFFAITLYYLGARSTKNKCFVLLIASVAAVNNLDFGLCAFAATAASLALWEVLGNRRLNLIALWKNISLALAMLLITLAAYVALVFCLSGKIPNLAGATGYLKVFASYGYGMEPAPDIGLYWIIYITFMAAVLRALILIWRATIAPPNQQLHAALLLYCGIFGAGSMLYFIGRSHPYTLIVFFFFWSITTMLLILDFVRNFSPANQFQRLPMALYAFFFSLMFTNFFFQAPNLSGEFQRLHSRGNDLKSGRQGALTYLKKYLSPGDKIALAVPYGDLLAKDLDVINTFPFAHPMAIFLVSQSDQFVEEVLASQTSWVFGLIQAESRTKLQAAKFNLVGQFDNWELWNNN